MGYVYILSNDNSIGILKIGKTSKDPVFRVEQLNRQTGVIGTYKLEWSKEVEDCDIVEKVLHHIFRDFRVQKEFFRIELNAAIQIADKTVNSFLGIETNLESEIYEKKRIEILEDEIKLAKTEEEKKKLKIEIAKIKSRKLLKTAKVLQEKLSFEEMTEKEKRIEIGKAKLKAIKQLDELAKLDSEEIKATNSEAKKLLKDLKRLDLSELD